MFAPVQRCKPQLSDAAGIRDPVTCQRICFRTESLNRGEGLSPQVVGGQLRFRVENDVDRAELAYPADNEVPCTAIAEREAEPAKGTVKVEQRAFPADCSSKPPRTVQCFRWRRCAWNAPAVCRGRCRPAPGNASGGVGKEKDRARSRRSGRKRFRAVGTGCNSSSPRGAGGSLGAPACGGCDTGLGSAGALAYPWRSDG